MADGSTARDEKGAESSGEINGLGWRVFRVHENGAQRFVLVAYVAPGVRRKMRLPVEQKNLTTPQLRARFAKGAAAQMIRDRRGETAPTAPANQPDPLAVTFDEFARLWTSGKLAKMYPAHVRVKASVDADVQRLDFMKPLIGNVAL